MEWNYATLKRFGALCKEKAYKQRSAQNGISRAFEDALFGLNDAIDSIPIASLPDILSENKAYFRLTYNNIQALGRLALDKYSAHFVANETNAANAAMEVYKACGMLRTFF